MHWAREGHGQPAVVYLGADHTDEDAYRLLREQGYAVHVGPPATESAASCWVADQAAAFDLLAQIALAWSVRPARRVMRALSFSRSLADRPIPGPALRRVNGDRRVRWIQRRVPDGEEAAAVWCAVYRCGFSTYGEIHVP